MFVYPHPDPVALSLGPLSIRWYGLMYLVGFVAAWWLARRRAAGARSTWTPTEVDDLIFYCALGVILGGRLGWMLFYGTERILADPLSVLRIWEGGMSFHGGLVGVLVALALFAGRRGKQLGDVFDFTAPLPAIGFGAGRIGNFINGELWGKPTDVPWAVIVDGVPLHASQLYEAFLEGLVRMRRSSTRRSSRGWCCSWSCGGSRRSRGRAGRRPGCSSRATACSASRSNSCACPMPTAATCCSTG